jgi:hypothetical protein
MNNQAFFMVQTLELRRLLEMAGDDPVMAPQLRRRLERAEKALETVNETARSAILLGGDEVAKSPGIRAALAGEVRIETLTRFEAVCQKTGRTLAEELDHAMNRHADDPPSVRAIVDASPLQPATLVVPEKAKRATGRPRKAAGG